MRKQKDKYLTHWKEFTKKVSKLECYLALNREYTVLEYPNLRKALTRHRLSEHSLAIEKGCCRQTWLSREDRLCAQCPQNEVEPELHFLTSCPMYDHIRDTYFPQITQTHKEFENKSNFDKFPYLLGEIPLCAITAARFGTRKGQQVKKKHNWKYNLYLYLFIFPFDL